MFAALERQVEQTLLFFECHVPADDILYAEELCKKQDASEKGEFAFVMVFLRVSRKWKRMLYAQRKLQDC
jgi:hypothetical protein